MYKKSFSSLHLTHILLIFVIVICATIVTTLFHYTQALATLYIVGAGIIFYNKDNSLTTLFICSLIFSFLIVSRINQQYAQYSSHQTWLHKPVTIEGIITSVHASSLHKEQTTITIQTIFIHYKNRTLFEKKTISLFFPNNYSQHFQEYQHIKIHNVNLEQPAHESDYQRYLIKEGVWAIAHCNNHVPEITQEASLSLQKTYLKQMYNALIPTTSLFNPLFLGKKEKSKQALNIQHQSVYWGAAHHMARSGIHLGVLFGLFMIFFHYINITNWMRYILSATILLLYAYVSISSISFLRALCMIFLHIICKLLKRMPSTLHILTLTTIATLLHNPMQLLFLDFQLSFGITYILIWLFLTKNNKTIAIS